MSFGKPVPIDPNEIPKRPSWPGVKSFSQIIVPLRAIKFMFLKRVEFISQPRGKLIRMIVNKKNRPFRPV
jgi:hypothetical protein